jgi:hypothetical protein
MYNKPGKCMTPNCLNTTHHLLCLSCSAKEQSRKAMEAALGLCIHNHSITGDYDMIMRFLPEYKGGPPQDGYMLDICKSCLQPLQERPYNPVRLGRGH